MLTYRLPKFRVITQESSQSVVELMIKVKNQIRRGEVSCIR